MTGARMTGARDGLRTRTRDGHDRVDAVYSSFRLDTREGYGAFLSAQAVAHLACEAALDRAHAEDVVPDWPARRRGDLLIEDLRDLELSVPVLAVGASADGAGGIVDVAPSISRAPSILGAVYVLEGSRLGGAMLVRSVPYSLPRRFLGASVPGAWRNLMQMIDRTLQSDEQIAAAVAAARRVFELFERAGRTSMKVD